MADQRWRLLQRTAVSMGLKAPCWWVSCARTIMAGFLLRLDSRRGRRTRGRGSAFVFVDGVDDGGDGGEDGDDGGEIHDDFLSVQASRGPDLSVSGCAYGPFANLRG